MAMTGAVTGSRTETPAGVASAKEKFAPASGAINVFDPGAVPFVDLSIGNFGDIISGARSLGANGSWVVRTPMGLLVHGYEQVRAVLRDQAWISVLAGAAEAQKARQKNVNVTAVKPPHHDDRGGSDAGDLTVLFEQAANTTQRNGRSSRTQRNDRNSRLQLTPRPNVLSVEGTDHQRLRRLVSAAFTPANANRLRPFMAEHARHLIDAFFTDSRTGNGDKQTTEANKQTNDENNHTGDGSKQTIELVTGLCRPYPIPIICELLGAPSADWKLFDRWAETILGVIDGDTDAVMERMGDIVTAQNELDTYVADLIAQRKAAPGEDLLSQLLAAHDQGDDQLSGDELAAMVEALLLAGTDTTRNQLGATLAALADHPDQYAALRNDPSLVPAAVEESLRYLSAVRSTARLATRDIELEGIVFPAGTTVAVGLHAASLQPADSNPVTVNPDSADSYRFDITAERVRPHLAFGSGIHHCLGAFLARAELQEALAQFVQRVESFELVEPVEWKPLSMGIWGPTRLAVRLREAGAETGSLLAAGSSSKPQFSAGTIAPASPETQCPHQPTQDGNDSIANHTISTTNHTNHTPNPTISTATPTNHTPKPTAAREAQYDRYLVSTAPIRKSIHTTTPALLRPALIPPLGRLAVTVVFIGWAVVAARLGNKIFRRGLTRDLTDKQRRAHTYSRLRRAAERLGPSYIKLAQLIAAGEGVFPDALVAECRSCRDKVRPESWKRIRRVLEAELGPLHQRFASIDPTPLAAASIAQVHNATLTNGTPVVVKVQRPRIQRRVIQDIKVLTWVAPRLVGKIPITALANPPALVELFAETISEELDFRVEVANMIEVGRALRIQPTLGSRRPWQLPTPHLDAVTKRVIVMSRIEGRPLASLGPEDLPDGMATSIFGQMTDSLLEGTCMHGIFHGDFHAGNVFIDEHGTIGLVDFGITGRLEGSRRIAFLRYVIGLLTGDVVAQVEGMAQLGAFTSEVDSATLMTELGLDRPNFDPLTLTEEEFVAEFRALISGLLSRGARIPKELMLFIKNFAYMTSVMGELDPDMDILAQFERTASSFVARNGIRMAGEIGFAVSADRVTDSALRQAMGVPQAKEPHTEEKITWRLLRRRRTELAERISSAPG